MSRQCIFFDCREILPLMLLKMFSIVTFSQFNLQKRLKFVSAVHIAVPVKYVNTKSRNIFKVKLQGSKVKRVQSISLIVYDTTRPMEKESFHVFRAKLFNDSCNELVSWMKEKENILSGSVHDLDVETVRKLQRKHQVSKKRNQYCC